MLGVLAAPSGELYITLSLLVLQSFCQDSLKTKTIRKGASRSDLEPESLPSVISYCDLGCVL